VILIKDGMLVQDESFSGLPIKIDGEFHPVSGDPAFDKIALKIVDPRHLEINAQKDGKPAAEVQVELSGRRQHDHRNIF